MTQRLRQSQAPLGLDLSHHGTGIASSVKSAWTHRHFSKQVCRLLNFRNSYPLFITHRQLPNTLFWFGHAADATSTTVGHEHHQNARGATSVHETSSSSSTVCARIRKRVYGHDLTFLLPFPDPSGHSFTVQKSRKIVFLQAK